MMPTSAGTLKNILLEVEAMISHVRDDLNSQIARRHAALRVEGTFKFPAAAFGLEVPAQQAMLASLADIFDVEDIQTLLQQTLYCSNSRLRANRALDLPDPALAVTSIAVNDWIDELEVLVRDFKIWAPRGTTDLSVKAQAHLARLVHACGITTQVTYT